MTRIVGIESCDCAAREFGERDIDRGERGNLVVLGSGVGLDGNPLAIGSERARGQFDGRLPFGIVEIRVGPSRRNRGAVENFDWRHRQRLPARDVLAVGGGASFPRRV